MPLVIPRFGATIHADCFGRTAPPSPCASLLIHCITTNLRLATTTGTCALNSGPRKPLLPPLISWRAFSITCSPPASPTRRSGLLATGSLLFSWYYMEHNALFRAYSALLVPKFVRRFFNRRVEESERFHDASKSYGLIRKSVPQSPN